MTTTTPILLVEDDRLLNRLLTGELKRMGYAVTSVHCWRDAHAHLDQYEPALIVADVQLPDANTLDLLPSLTQTYPVIVLTAFGTVQGAVAAMKAGARQYLTKPIDPDELELEVKRVLQHSALSRDQQFCKERLRPSGGMVGASAAMAELQRLIDAVADSEATVLIQGESGVGKELVAHAIHERSPRAARNFVAVDCCTLQEKLFESELFGHEKGAFTGAERQKPGLIEAAQGGTLFLDEIGEIEPVIQAKLLRVLESGEYRRLGGVKDLQANVRIVAATNRNLTQMSKDGKFRADLYYRLSAFTLRIPPLRERLQDIPALVEHFLAHHNFSRRLNKRLNPAALRLLMAYGFPGNIRELRNMVERAIIVGGGSDEIRPEHFSFEALGEQPGQFSMGFQHEPTLDEIERRYLELLVAKYAGHRGQIAAILGVSERSIYRLLEKHGFKGEA
ncbi:MAG: Fis family transcriptional regulator [Hydrogenophilales bacterium 28-61-23]|nr:MAG: Fis family transcriptional regulator [Hydrogenophilales bacterium 28-61-23]